MANVRVAFETVQKSIQAILNARFPAGAAPALMLCAALLAGCSTHAAAAENINYTMTDTGPLWQRVHDALPEIHPDEWFGDIQVRSFLGIAQADLNNDSPQEILAYVVPEPEWVQPGYPGNLHAIFQKNSDGSLTRLWSGKANGLMLGDSYKNGMRDIVLLTNIDGSTSVTYEWNGQTYVPK